MKENKAFEVKEQITNTFLKTVCAYANYGTGVIQFGITDKGKVVGIKNTKDACLDIENRINDSISPNPDYQINVDEEMNVITLTVFEGDHKPYFYKSKAYKRNDTATIEVGRMELKRLILEGEHRSFDEMIAEEQEYHFTVLEKKMKEQLGIQAMSQDILRTIGIADVNGQCNNAGALLADENSFCGIDCARFGETIDIILDRETFDRKSVLQQYDDVITLYRKYYQYDEIKGAIRETIEMIPEKAFRETIANALVHRAWDIRSQIRVAMYADRIEVFTPGGLPRGITEREYLEGQVSVLRNPILGGVFYRLHLIESFGTGIQRIYASYRNSDVKPKHSFSENVIKVVLPVISSSSGLKEDEKTVFNTLDRIGKQSSQIVRESGFGKNKALKILDTLEQRGYVSKSGNGRGTRYSVK